MRTALSMLLTLERALCDVVDPAARKASCQGVRLVLWTPRAVYQTEHKSNWVTLLKIVVASRSQGRVQMDAGNGREEKRWMRVVDFFFFFFVCNFCLGSQRVRFERAREGVWEKSAPSHTFLTPLFSPLCSHVNQSQHRNECNKCPTGTGSTWFDLCRTPQTRDLNRRCLFYRWNG